MNFTQMFKINSIFKLSLSMNICELVKRQKLSSNTTIGILMDISKSFDIDIDDNYMYKNQTQSTVY